MTKIRVEKEFSSTASEGSDGSSAVEEFSNDEFDCAEIESGSEGSETLVDDQEHSSHSGHFESDGEALDAKQPKSAKKARKAFNPDALASAFQTVLRQNLPSTNVDQKSASVPAGPILSRRKAVERNIEEEEIDRAARHILKAQIRATQEAIHTVDANAPESLNFERSLRKLATRGVVQLFNSIQSSQHEEDEKIKNRRKERLSRAHKALPLSAPSVISTESRSSSSYFEFLKGHQNPTSRK